MTQKTLENQEHSPDITLTETAFPPGENLEMPVKTPWLSGGRSLLFGIGIGVLLTLVGTRLLTLQEEKTPIATTTDGAIPTVSSANASQVTAQTVTVTEVKTTPVNRTIKATGTIAAFEMIPVLSQATGLQIKEILTDEGQFVKAGQVLARLDDALLQAQLAQADAAVAGAEARLAELRAGTRVEEIARAKENVKSARSAVVQAKSDLDLAGKRVERNKNLQLEGAIALDRLDEFVNLERDRQAKLEQAKAYLEEMEQKLAELNAGPRPEVITQAEAQLTQAKAQRQLVLAQLKDARVVAPVSGKVAERKARVGDITSSSDKLFTIIENGRLELLLKIPETQLTVIRSGQNVEIKSNQNQQLTLTGKVREIVPLVDEQSRQATVKVDLPAGKSLKPGMFLQGEIITSVATGLTAPMGAILPQADGTAIAYMVLADRKVKATTVKMGEILPGKQMEILSGLNQGDTIVVKGAAYLKDGDRIKISNNDAKGTLREQDL